MKSTDPSFSRYDGWLIFSVIGLILLGLVMVASSSVMISTKYFNDPFHFFIRQLIYLLAGLGFSILVMRIQMSVWQQYGLFLLGICMVLLMVVLIPGIGRVVNGSRRWLALGPIGIQVSELAKMVMILYVSGYFVREQKRGSKGILFFIKPMLVLSIVACLLLKEPDFGATVVLTGTVMCLLFLSGVQLRYYLGLLFLVVIAMAILAISSPYRVARLTGFLNPWADQFNTGYQLTQSLIAFGRGGWFGMGLGESVQKLLYLPEAHTDFIFAVLAEELGVCGIILILILYIIFIWRGFTIGYKAYQADFIFSAFVAYGITVWFGLQAIINMGVNVGLLPTKGLTLPLISYGGASLVVNCLAIALLLRIDHENRWHRFE